MNIVHTIEYLRDLENKKDQLVDCIDLLNQEIENERNVCSHIPVILGVYCDVPNMCDKYCCLVCGSVLETKRLNIFKDIVHAQHYLTNFDISNDLECKIKLGFIQVIALDLLKEKPGMSVKKLVDKLNKMIRGDSLLERCISLKKINDMQSKSYLEKSSYSLVKRRNKEYYNK